MVSHRITGHDIWAETKSNYSGVWDHNPTNLDYLIAFWWTLRGTLGTLLRALVTRGTAVPEMRQSNSQAVPSANLEYHRRMYYWHVTKGHNIKEIMGTVHVSGCIVLQCSAFPNANQSR